MDLAPELIALLVAVAFCAGIVDAIAGGGGLITVPALVLALGDPVAALATNKLQGSFGTVSAAAAFWRAGHINLRAAMPLVVVTFVGAILGVVAVGAFPIRWLQAALPVLMIGIAAFFALSGKLRDADARRRLGAPAFAVVAMGIGFYDGLFGPGAGSFFMLAFIALAGYGAVKATANTKLLNAASNVAGLLAFAWSGHVVWLLGLAMALGQIAGGQIGARMAMRGGARLVKPLIVGISLAMALRLLLDESNPLRVLLLNLFAR